MPKTIYVNNSILPKDKKFTFLTGDVVAGVASIGVQSTIGFHSLSTSSGQIVLIGELGQERSEILRTEKDTAPTGTGIGLEDILRFDHPQDTKIYIIDWNRFEVQHAVTVSGTKTTLMAYPEYLQADQLESIYRDTTKTSGYYFIRFNETIGSTNSDFSDAIPYGGFADNTVHAVKQRALEQLNEKYDDELITDEYLNRCLWEARREYHQAPGKRPFRRRYNYDIGNALTGSFRIELPLWVEKPWTAENIYGVRIGTEANMEHYGKKEWDFDWRNIPRSYLDHAYTRGTSTSIWLANGRDFSGSPTIQVEGMNIGCTRITGSQNSFTITSHGSYPSASAGSDAYENVSWGLPNKFTVFAEPDGSAYIYFNRPIDTAYINQNIYLDAYMGILARDSDADELDEPNPDIYTPYLKYKIKNKKANGTIPLTDPDYLEWLKRKQEALNNEYLGVDINFVPDLPNEFPS